MEKQDQWSKKQWEQWEKEKWDLKQELGKEYYKTNESVCDLEDKEGVLEDKWLKDEEGILQKDKRGRAGAGAGLQELQQDQEAGLEHQELQQE